MDWFTIGALVVIGAVAVLVARWVSGVSGSRRSSPGDRDDLDTLEWKHDDIKRGTSPENSGL
ncbi:hypothetical protein [Mycetocola miduiensis]|uniref:Uncharacterized protein n=1 Tax=Mycetocola miduiensis TaxID=995034 RepID=A0A1I5CRH9_9MICO|nr:hypothetical protein [Mycetocola miduiensis]SFN89543.1 hypothetical protein SAMN05216219_2506 [Mycetocola miduiensis]